MYGVPRREFFTEDGEPTVRIHRETLRIDGARQLGTEETVEGFMEIFVWR